MCLASECLVELQLLHILLMFELPAKFLRPLDLRGSLTRAPLSDCIGARSIRIRLADHTPFLNCLLLLLSLVAAAWDLASCC